MAEVFANSEDPNQTPRSAASDLGLHSFPVTLLGVSRLQWVRKVFDFQSNQNGLNDPKRNKNYYLHYDGT